MCKATKNSFSHVYKNNASMHVKPSKYDFIMRNMTLSDAQGLKVSS